VRRIEHEQETAAMASTAPNAQSMINSIAADPAVSATLAAEGFRTPRFAFPERGRPEKECVFLLGGPPHWAVDSAVPLMISANALARYRPGSPRFPSARCPWALDSGGFTHVLQHGAYLEGPDEYGGMVYRLMDELGTPPLFCSPQDWMTEPQITARTGFTVEQHQAFTVDSLLYLRAEFPHAPWMPVLQGQSLGDYLAHCRMYERAGVELAAEPRVGVGSVCRRQGTLQTGQILRELAGRGLALHGFGVKVDGLRRYGHLLASADNLAWSYGARRWRERLAGCDHRAADCRTCRRYALAWRERVVRALREPQQLALL
jgi:hypothetical protein